MKKIIIVIILLCLIGMAFFIFTYPSNTQSKIMFIPKSTLSTFWKITIEGFETAISEYNLYGEIRSTASEEDIVGQSKIVRQAIEEDFDAIVISANGYKQLATPVREAMAAGVEVVVIDSDVNVEEIKVRISTDNFQAGYNMAKKMAELMDYKGYLGIISFDTVTQNGEARVNGFLEGIKQFSDITIVDNIKTSSNAGVAQVITEELLEKNKNITALVTFNEITTVGMCRAIEKYNKVDLVCGGFDNNIQVMDYLEKDIIDMTVVQNQFAMGYLGAIYAKDSIEGKIKKPTKINTGTHIITKENMFDLQTVVFPFYLGRDEQGRVEYGD